MKYVLIVVSFVVTLQLQAQIRGNGNIVTKRIPISTFETIDISLYAKTTIDCQSDEFLEITMDENLFEHIQSIVENESLILDQKEWVRASEDVIITIGAPNLKKLHQSTHDKTIVNNFSAPALHIEANTGSIQVVGSTQDLNISVGVAKVDAQYLMATNGNFFFESWGEIIANVKGKVIANANSDGKLKLVRKPENFEGNVQYMANKNEKAKDESIRFIKFKLRNNSINRNQFYVVGPKPDGNKFSYGFPMMPNQVRDKDWTNGTKVYKVNNLGLRKLVKVIDLDDEGETVDIFEK